MENHVVLGHLFNYLDLKTLKSARLVCRNWSDAGIQRLRNGKLLSLQLYPFGRNRLRLDPCGDLNGTVNLIPFKPPLTLQDVDAIHGFICNGRIPHSLRVSLQPVQPFPWFHRENAWIYFSDLWEMNKAGEIYTYERQKNRGELILKLFLNTGTWITVLRLETTMVDEEDATLLTKILASIPHVTKCYLDFVRFDDLGFLSLPSNNLFPNSLTTLGIQLHQNYVDVIMHRERKVLSLSTVTHFMKAVSLSTIQFLDFKECNQMHYSMDSENMGLFVKAIHSIVGKNPNSFSNLIGISTKLDGCADSRDQPGEELQLWYTFPKSLRHLDLFIWQFPERGGSIGKLEKVSSILQQHISTLQSLNLFWMDDEAVEFHTKLELPRMPLLTTLDFSSIARLSWDGWTLDMLDLLNLRDIFLLGPQALRLRFPSLKTLSVFMFYESGTAIWEYIFPENVEFQQIETLNVSLVIDKLADDCISPLLTHFQTIFPSLKTLRHIKRLQNENDENEPIDAVCKHTLQNGLVTSKTTICNSWNNFDVQSKHYSNDLPMHYLLMSNGSDPYLFYDC